MIERERERDRNTWVKPNWMIPSLEIRPLVGLIPYKEFDAEGLLIELTVSLPVPNVEKEAPTAATVPPELPPGVRVRSYGLWVCPPKLETDKPAIKDEGKDSE